MNTIVITGANRGIGLELARLFSRRGDQVVAVCRQTSEDLTSLGVRVEDGIDVTRREDLQALAERLGDIDIDVLINNAGLLRGSSLDGIEDELDSWRAQYEINALAPLRVTSALRARIKRGGKLIIITSRMGSISDNESGGHYAYRMSKTAVNCAGVCLAHELKADGIAVGLLHPGYVRTDMTGGTGHIGPDEAAAGLVARIDELDLAASGSFRHANGEHLPW